MSRTQIYRWGVWYACANALLLSIIASGNVPLGAVFDAPIAGAFIVLALPGHFFALALIAMLPAVLLTAAAKTLRFAAPVAVACACVLGAIVLVDVKLYDLYRFHIDGMVLELLAGGAANDILAFTPAMWLAALAAIGGVGLVQSLLGLALWRASGRRSMRVRGPLAAMFVVMGLGQAIYVYADAVAYQPVMFQLRYVPWGQPVTAKSALRGLGIGVARSDVRIAGAVEGHMRYPLQPLRCDATDLPNVVMLVIDSARFDLLTPEVMPNVAALAEQSIVFDRHYSTGNATRFGIFGLMYGLPGSYWFPALGEQRGTVLVDELKRRDYELMLYGSAPLTSPEFDRTVFAAVNPDLAPPQPGTVVERDRGIAQAFMARLAARRADRPYFAFLFFDAPHAYAVPEGFRPFEPMLDEVNYLDLGPDFDRLPFFNRYRASVHYVDQLIGEVLRALDAAVGRDTIVLVTGDHGQAFNENGQNEWGHNNSFSRYEVQVPFVLRWPGQAPRHVSATSSHVDWVPTLLRHGLGCANPPGDYSTGVDLFDLGPGPRVVPLDQWARRGVIDGDRVYEFERWGEVTVRDADYRVLAGERPRPAALTSVLEAQTRFLDR